MMDKKNKSDLSDLRDSEKSWLPFFTRLLAVTSVVVVSTALATNSWLFTEELISSVFLQNETEPHVQQRLQFVKKTISGLWTICVANVTNDNIESYECFLIYEVFDECYNPDPDDSTWAVPYAATRSVGFFLLSTVLLCFAELCFVISLLKKKDWCIFVSGITFIIAGLLMLVGVIAFISLFRAEVGNKLRSPSMNKSPPLTFSYGFSFQLYMCGLALIEVTGTCAIFLYLKNLTYSMSNFSPT